MSNRFDNLNVDQLFDQIAQYCADAQDCDIDNISYELDKIRLLVNMIEDRVASEVSNDE